MRLLLAQLYWDYIREIYSFDRPENRKRIWQIRIDPDLEIRFQFTGRYNE